MIEDLILKNEEFVIPSLWIRDGEKEYLKKALDNIKSQNCNCFCIEPRPYKNFCKEEWFNDLSFVIDYCEKNAMSFYILDDFNYPTGFANGYIRNHQEYKARFLRCDFVDTYGEQKNRKFKLCKEVGDILISATMIKSVGNEFINTGIDLLDNIKNDILYVDIPDGQYRIIFIYSTLRGFEKENFIDLTKKESVDILIKECYEPHFNKFEKYCGNIIKGFFSDEPRFANGMSKPYYIRNVKIGSQGLALPFSSEILEEFKSSQNNELINLLPSLWFNVKGNEEVRVSYMDALTRITQENFSKRIKKWCNDRNLKHIGHVIEDCNGHTRLANGLGNYFRAIDDYDMAGIDIVLCHLLPGVITKHSAYSLENIADMDFFEYVLPKLCSSSANLTDGDRLAMCEVFGAYGHGADMSLLKWITDLMLVRGINCFVVQGYTMRDNDIECPPHFHSQNPINEHMSKLIKYMFDMSGLLYKSKHMAKVMLLYNAELDWAGNENNFNATAKTLTQNQIDFEIVNLDKLKNALIKDKKVIIGKEEFSALVVPYSDYYPKCVLDMINKLKKEIHVLYSDKKLIKNLNKRKLYDVKCKGNTEKLVYNHIQKGKDVYIFFNEGVDKIDAEVKFPISGKAVVRNMLTGLSENVYIANKYDLRLEKFESKIVVFDNDMELSEKLILNEKVLDGEYDILLSNAEDKDNFRKYITTDKLFDVTGKDGVENFCGFIKYRKKFTIENKYKKVLIKLIQSGGSVKIYVNGKEVDTLICNPYEADISDFVKDGENDLEIIFATTPVYAKNDIYSQYLTLGYDGLENYPIIQYQK